MLYSLIGKSIGHKQPHLGNAQKSSMILVLFDIYLQRRPLLPPKVPSVASQSLFGVMDMEAGLVIYSPSTVEFFFLRYFG